MDKFAVEVTLRGLAGTTEAVGNVAETAAGACSEPVPEGLTAPVAWSSRTIASTIAASLASSIHYLLKKKEGSPAFSVSTPSFINPRSTSHFSNSGAGRSLKSWRSVGASWKEVHWYESIE